MLALLTTPTGTAAMVLYPPLCNALGFDTPWTGVMIVDLMVSADSESFEAIARAMLAADSTKANEAFKRAIDEQIARAQRRLDRIRARAAAVTAKVA